MKIQGQQNQIKAATPQEMKKIVKEQETIFQQKLDNVDNSRTKIERGKYETVRTYYDKEGNELFSRSELPDAGSKNVALTYIYAYNNKDGSSVRFIDNDRDGNMDRMDYSKEQIPYFQAFDKNDDGTFDVGMPNFGENIGKNFDIKN